MIIWLLTLDESLLARYAYACHDTRNRYLLPSNAKLANDSAFNRAATLYKNFVADKDSLTKLIDGSPEKIASNFLIGLRLISKLELLEDASPIYLNLRKGAVLTT